MTGVLVRCASTAALMLLAFLPDTHGQSADKSPNFEPIITEEYALFPVTTELQRQLLESDSITVCVFVNGSAFRGVDKVDRFHPALMKLQKQLQDLPKGDNAGVIFNCIDGHVPGEPSGALRERLEKVSKASEEVGYYSGFLNVKWSRVHTGDFNWQEFIGQAQDAATSASSSDESPVGNERIQVYPVRTILSRLSHSADCLVDVMPVVTGKTQFPDDLEEDLKKYIPEHTYAGQRTLLLSIKQHESAREMVSAWNENIEGRKAFARKFGFAECNVNSSYVDEQSMMISVVDADLQPVEGVQVRLNHVYRSRGSEKTSIENKQYVTPGSGRAVISRSGESVDLRLWFAKPGYVPLFAIWALDHQSDGDQIPDEFEISIAPGTEIGGIVTDEAGKPIQGARVDVCDATAFQFAVVRAGRTPGIRPVRSPTLAEDETAPVTDVQGRWSLNTVPADRDLVFDESLSDQAPELPIRLRVRHPDYPEFNAIDAPTIAGSPTLQQLRQKTAKVVLSKSATSKQPAHTQNYPE